MVGVQDTLCFIQMLVSQWDGFCFGATSAGKGWEGTCSVRYPALLAHGFFGIPVSVATPETIVPAISQLKVVIRQKLALPYQVKEHACEISGLRKRTRDTSLVVVNKLGMCLFRFLLMVSSPYSSLYSTNILCYYKPA